MRDLYIAQIDKERLLRKNLLVHFFPPDPCLFVQLACSFVLGLGQVSIAIELTVAARATQLALRFQNRVPE